MKFKLHTGFIWLVCCLATSAEAKKIAYLNNTDDSGIVSLDLENHKFGKKISCTGRIWSFTFTPDGLEALVPGINPIQDPYQPSVISIIDLEHEVVKSTIKISSGWNSDIEADPRGGLAYLYTGLMRNINVVELSSKEIVATISVGMGMQFAVGHDLNTAYVGGLKPKEIAVVDLHNEKISHSIPLTQGVTFIRVTADGNTLCALCSDGKARLFHLPECQLKSEMHITSESFGALELHPDSKRAFVGAADHHVAIIDLEKAVVAKTIHVGGNPISFAVDADEDKLYALCGKSISVIDLHSQAVIETISVPFNSSVIHILNR